jgi:hypothetical protein
MDEHERGKDDEVQARQGFWQALVVAFQPPEAVEPSKTALHHPATRQQPEALFRLGLLDDPQVPCLRYVQPVQPHRLYSHGQQRRASSSDR